MSSAPVKHLIDNVTTKTVMRRCFKIIIVNFRPGFIRQGVIAALKPYQF